jgi:hypothetical protein
MLCAPFLTRVAPSAATEALRSGNSARASEVALIMSGMSVNSARAVKASVEQ